MIISWSIITLWSTFLVVDLTDLSAAQGLQIRHRPTRA